jgi:hypothetical protein
MKENICQPRLYPAKKLSFIIEKIKTFHNKQKLFMTSKPSLQMIHKSILHTEKRKINTTMKM